MPGFLALIFLSTFIYISSRQVLWGAVLLVAFLPIYLCRLSLLGLPTTFLELMVTSLFIIWLLKDKKYKNINWRRKNFSQNKISSSWRYLLIAWLVASLLALAVNPQWSALGLWRAYFLEPLMFFLVLVYEIKDDKDQKW